MMVKVNMRRRQHRSGEVMLLFDQTLGQAVGMMVVQKRNRPKKFLVRPPLKLNKLIANQVADEFRTILILILRDELFELVEQRLFDGHTYANNFRHASLLAVTRIC